jgi:formylglycine-generating enzyme required for sulfatase activity
VGNYADSAFHEKFPSAKWLDGYTDGYAGTAPVGSFPANDYGIYDMGGNLWEWCEDLIKPGDAGHVVRGGSWDYGDRGNLLSSSRRSYHAGANYILIGFRCVVEVPAR